MRSEVKKNEAPRQVWKRRTGVVVLVSGMAKDLGVEKRSGAMFAARGFGRVFKYDTEQLQRSEIQGNCVMLQRMGRSSLTVLQSAC